MRLKAEYEFKGKKSGMQRKKKILKASEQVPGTTVKGLLNCCQERVSWLFNGKNKQVADEKRMTEKVNFFVIFLTEGFDCDEKFNK